MKTKLLMLAAVTAILLPCLVIRGQEPANPDGSRPDVHKKRSVDDLITLAKSTNSDERLSAARELNDLGSEAKKAVPVLIKLLDDDLSEVRMEAAFALGKIGPDAKAAVPRLAKSLTDRDASVRAAASCRISPTGRRRCKTGRAGLGEPAWQAGNWQTRMHAAEGLGDFGPEARSRLAEASRIVGRPRAGRSRGCPSGTVSDSNPRRKPAVLARRRLRDDKEWRITPAANVKREGCSLSELIESTKDANPEVREEAANALNEMGPAAKAAVPALIRLLDDKAKGVRQDAALAFGAIGPDAKASVPALIKLLDDKENGVRLNAAQALGAIGPAAKRPCRP